MVLLINKLKVKHGIYEIEFEDEQDDNAKGNRK